MPGLRRALWAIAALGAAESALAVALTLASDHVSQPGLQAALGFAIGWAFIATGLFAWMRRPDNRFGALMTGVGFAWFLGALTSANASGWFTAGVLLSNLYLVAFVHMVLAYPDGRLEARWHGRLVAAGYVLSVVGPLPNLMFRRDGLLADCECPPSAVLVRDDETLRLVFDGITTGLAIVLVACVVLILGRRWRAATGPQRRTLAPVLWSAVVLLLLVAGSLATATVGLTGATDVFGGLGLIAFAATPFLFLFGLLRVRVATAGFMSDLLVRLGEAPSREGLRDLLAEALRDPSLEVLYWLERGERWVDGEGRPARPPSDDDPGRAWTPVAIEDRVVGAIVHDRQLCEDVNLLRSVAAAAALTVEHGRLQAELRARVEDLRRSRTHVVEAAIAERRRLERNLHDGAQQRLVALSLTLRLAQARIERDPDAARDLLAGAQDELALALEELRELARGIHPAVLSDRGLKAALEALAGRSPIPVEVSGTPIERLPEPVEAAAYYVVAEALTNVAKYARASHATVRIDRVNGSALVQVADDGVGGADPQRGTGLQGLADRIAALDGRLRVESPPGAGTRLEAEIPV